MAEEKGESPKSEAMLTTSQAAGRLKCSLQAVQRRCQQGLFPGAVHFGRDWQIPEKALQGLVIQSRNRKTKAERGE